MANLTDVQAEHAFKKMIEIGEALVRQDREMKPDEEVKSGAQKALANLLGLDPPAITQAKNKGWIPHHWVRRLAKAAADLQLDIGAHDLRPDMWDAPKNDEGEGATS